VEAAASGARVLVLERAAVPGGTRSLAGGHLYFGGGTAVQTATGHEDSPEEMARYLMAACADPKPDKIRAYCDDTVWLPVRQAEGAPRHAHGRVSDVPRKPTWSDCTDLDDTPTALSPPST
jgi:phytoene dehydrogenase-like protein